MNVETINFIIDKYQRYDISRTMPVMKIYETLSHLRFFFHSQTRA